LPGCPARSLQYRAAHACHDDQVVALRLSMLDDSFRWIFFRHMHRVARDAEFAREIAKRREYLHCVLRDDVLVILEGNRRHQGTGLGGRPGSGHDGGCEGCFEVPGELQPLLHRFLC